MTKERQVIDRRELIKRLNKDLDALRAGAPPDERNELEGCEFRDVELHARDASGCNWSVKNGFYFNGSRTPLKEATRNRIVEAARGQYWLDELPPSGD